MAGTVAHVLVTLFVLSVAVALLDMNAIRFDDVLHKRSRDGSKPYREIRWRYLCVRTLAVDMPIYLVSFFLAKTSPWSVAAIPLIGLGRYFTGAGQELHDDTTTFVGRVVTVVPQFLAFILPLAGSVFRATGGKLSP